MKPPIYIVLDTNVLVSALLKRDSPPGRILDLILSGAIKPVFDDRIFQEYASVIARPRFNIPQDSARQVLTFLSAAGKRVQTKTLEPTPQEILDPGDLPFAEAAVSGNAWALVTGNQRHFTFFVGYGPIVVTPTEFLEHLFL